MANQGRQPEEENKTQDVSTSEAKQSARDERAARGDQNRTNRSESEGKRARTQKVGQSDSSGVYKHEGVGAVTQENMRTEATVRQSNEEDAKKAEKDQLDTSSAARDKALEFGAKNKRTAGNYASTEAGEEIVKALEEEPLRRVVDQSNQAERHGSSASAPVVEYAFTTRLVKKNTESDVKATVVDGFGRLYDEWEKGLSSSEREAFAYDPYAGVVSFRKHLSTLDENDLRGRLVSEEK